MNKTISLICILLMIPTTLAITKNYAIPIQPIQPALIEPKLICSCPLYDRKGISSIISSDNYVMVDNGTTTNLSINELYLNETIISNINTITTKAYYPLEDNPAGYINDIGNGIENYTARWVNDTILGIGIIRDNGKTIGISTTPSSLSLIKMNYLNKTTGLLMTNIGTNMTNSHPLYMDDYSYGVTSIMLNRYRSGLGMFINSYDQLDLNNPSYGLNIQSVSYNTTSYGLHVGVSQGTGIIVESGAVNAILMNLTEYPGKNQKIILGADTNYPKLKGVGNAFACIDENGTLYRSNINCI